MTKMKWYKVYKSGSTDLTQIMASCITKAAKQFIDTLDNPAKFALDSKWQGNISYSDNHTIMSDFVIIEKF